VSEAITWIEQYREVYNVYVGVNPRASSTSGTNADIKHSHWIWIDIDSKKLNNLSADKILAKVLRRIVLPPHIVVFSGGGVHLYYRIIDTTDLKEVQRVCNLLSAEIGGDPLGDPARIFRVPDTFNYKQDTPREVTLAHCLVDFEYPISDIIAALAVSEKVAKRVDIGDSRGFLSRSERDWNVVRSLLKAGIDEETVRYIYSKRRVGDKASEEGDKYLERTIEKGKQSIGLNEDDYDPSGEDEDSPTPVKKKGKISKSLRDRWTVKRSDGCMFAVDGTEDSGAMRQIATFEMIPRILLQGNIEDKTEDTIICDIKAADFTWEGIPFTRGAFNRVDSMTKQLPAMAWQWLGSDKDVRRLLAVLMDELRAQGLPKRRGTPVIGIHGEEFVGPSQTMTTHGILPPDEARMVWLPTQRVHPKVGFTWSQDDEVSTILREFVDLFSQINTEDVIYPVLGWYVACFLKQRMLEEERVRFPILNIFGTRGSGKTSLITGVMQPLVCYVDPVAWDFNSTKFVMLSLLGSTNSVPVSFAEYRRSSATNDNLERYVRLTYDLGEDSRGKPDQTTQNYPLIAPFTIDGEDSIADPACMERLIQVTMHPETIAEGTAAYTSFQILRELPLGIIGTRLVAWLLDYEPKYSDSLELMKASFPATLPDRVRRNLAVVTVGLQAFSGFCEMLEVDFPKVDTAFVQRVLTPILDNVVNKLTGRTALVVDEFIQDVINAVAMSVDQRPPSFIYRYTAKENILYVHLTTALTWWFRKRAGERLEVRDSAAMKAQLRERMSPNGSAIPGFYVLETTTKNIDGRPTHVYPIDIEMAEKTGLDIGTKLTRLLEIYDGGKL
jgi:hypothetical protein